MAGGSAGATSVGCWQPPTRSTRPSSCPPAPGSAGLPDLAAGISVYHSLRDVAMYLSQAINLTERLGFDGPAHKSNTTLYPPNRFRSVDCTDLDDYNSVIPPDSSHQYYRRSPKARDDIARAFTGQPVAPGESKLV